MSDHFVFKTPGYRPVFYDESGPGIVHFEVFRPRGENEPEHAKTAFKGISWDFSDDEFVSKTMLFEPGGGASDDLF